MHRDLSSPGPLSDVVSLFHEVELEDSHLVSTRLAGRDVDPDEIDVAVLSHLQFDHADGLAQIPHARSS